MTQPNIDQLFKQAIELDQAAQLEFLEALTPAVRGPLEDLLRSDMAAEEQGYMKTNTQRPRTDQALDPTFLASDQVEPKPDQTESMPDQIGPYKILQPIGKGGMGQVFMAQQTEPVKRRVAIKIIKTDTPTKEILARFEAERQALAMMNHQNIAKVLDAGITDEGLPYFAMELVKGIPITEYCNTNKLPPKERLELFVQTCRAIQHAHQKGIIHRDIKPGNVLVTLYDGKPVAKVIDFGLAKALQDTTQLTNRTLFTQYGQVVGTLAYMSPEQAEMNTLDVDTRTDVYSLGVILYELLTGSTPITRESMKNVAFDRILAMIREEEAPRLSARLSESGDAITGISEQRKTEPTRLSRLLKGDLDWIAVKALEKDRIRRYDGPSALADDVQRYLEDEPIEARPPSFRYRMQKAFRKHRAAFIAGASIAVLLVAGLLGTGTMWLKARAAESEARAAESEAIAEAGKARDAEASERLARADVEKERDRSIVAQKQTEATLARSNYFLAEARWDANRAGEANEFLDKVPPEYRHFEWHLAKRQFLGSDVTCYGHTDEARSVSYSPDGTQIASSSNDDTIKLWDASTGAELKTLKGHTEDVTAVRFSPNGKRIASASNDHTIKVWDASSGAELRTFTGHTSEVSGVSFSPDGTQIASSSLDRTVRLWDVATGEELKTLKGHGDAVYSVSFSPDGTRIASGGAYGIKLWDAVTGAVQKTLLGHTNIVYGVDFSPNGKQIVSGSRDYTIRLWDASKGTKLKVIEGNTDFIFSVCFSPDGTRIASASMDRTIKLWDTSTGKEYKTLKGHAERVNGVCFSPDGTRVASASGDETIKLWDITTNHHQQMALLQNTGNIVSLSFSPDAKRIVSGCYDNTIKLWDASTGEERNTFKGHTGGVRSVCFSPDGSRIVSGSDDKTVKLWDTLTGAELKTFNGHTRSIRGVCFSPDGSRIASASEDKTIKLWDASTGAELDTLKGHTNRISSVCFSPDGTRIASGSHDETIKLWDASTGEDLKTLEGDAGFVFGLTFSPDGTRIASAHWYSINLWNASTGAKLRTLDGHAELVRCVSFSPDGRRIGSGSDDGTLKLWEATTGFELKTLKVPTDRVACLRFSPDGKRIAFAEHHSNIKLWEPSDGEEMRTLRGHTDDVSDVSFSADSSRLYSQSEKDKFVWDTTTGERLEDAEWKDVNPSRQISPDGHWRAVASHNHVLLVDLRFSNTPREKNYRAYRERMRPRWHANSARAAKSRSDWFAIVIHEAWIMKLQPTRAAYDSLKRTHAKMDPAIAELLPPVVAEALALPKPPWTEAAALDINKRVWKIVAAPTGKLAADQLEKMQEVCNDHPRGSFFNTLGVAEYRAGNYETAIEACTKSLDMSPKELDIPGPHPGDLAFLAMSHFRLGHNEQANEFRKQLTEAMKHEKFQSDEEAVGFVKEVNELLDAVAEVGAGTNKESSTVSKEVNE